MGFASHNGKDPKLHDRVGLKTTFLRKPLLHPTVPSQYSNNVPVRQADKKIPPIILPAAESPERGWL